MTENKFNKWFETFIEEKKIKDIIVRIDLKNGDINNFLEHLTRGYIQQNF